MMLRVVLIVLSCCLLNVSSNGQIKSTSILRKDLPKTISFKGDFRSGTKWIDKKGDHIVLLTETGEVASKSGDGNRDAGLYAYHYVMLGDSLKLEWMVHDFVQDCPVDVLANFIENSFGITDLDGDGLSEIWLMYQVTCQGDVSPVPMKIIMYEGKQKYAIRGTSKVPVSEKETAGGGYSYDDAFKKAPASFREYGQKLWKKFELQKWE